MNNDRDNFSGEGGGGREELTTTTTTKMLTDMTPSAGQFYGGQIPSMGMNIGSHIQKPTVSVSAVSEIFVYTYIYKLLFNKLCKKKKYRQIKLKF